MVEGPLSGEAKSSPLFSEDLAPIPREGRTWNKWHLAALWVGMAVCIPTYLLASYMMKSGLTWVESLLIIGLANIIITLPMVLNGQAGVKYGIPFPVIGRAAFGIYGVHIPSVLRAVVACGWFGVQTWIGGLAIESIINALAGWPSVEGVTGFKLFCFLIFWVINMYFIWRGTESIKWLENFSAPLLILMGILLIIWGAMQAGSFGDVIAKSGQLGKPSASMVDKAKEGPVVLLHPLASHEDGRTFRAEEFSVVVKMQDGKTVGESGWTSLVNTHDAGFECLRWATTSELQDRSKAVFVQFRKGSTQSSLIAVAPPTLESGTGSKIWSYILWLTAMVGFWATMSISISDITRHAKSQRDQVAGQFIGLPTTMMLFSFIGIFVTSAAVINFSDILASEDAPWDPVSLLARFQTPAVVVFSQIFMLIATLSTNIAANVIAPANAFANLFPGKISFRSGGLITGLIGIAICPWWLMDSISSILIFISGLLGPVLGVLLSDYFLVRNKELDLSQLYLTQGAFTYQSGFNIRAMIALAAGIFTALIGYFIPSLEFLYSLSWFTGFFLSFTLYYFLMRNVSSKN